VLLIIPTHNASVGALATSGEMAKYSHFLFFWEIKQMEYS